MRKFEKENKQAGGGCCYGVTGGAKAAFLMSGALFLSGVSENALAQCVATTDCATLGYTESSCSDGGVKCPFGDKWACVSSKEETCAEVGFIYDCSGTGYESGNGKTCNNKYASCTCASGYEWKDGACTKRAGAILGQCTGYAKNCKIGQILNMDGSCSDYRVSGVEPVGIVVYIGGDGCGQALALEGFGTYQWSMEYVDIPDLFNYSSAPTNDFSSCENTKTVIDYSYKQYGDSAYKYYPAFWQVYNYAPSSMPETKGKWCLPAGGVLDSIDQNRTAIDQSLTRINKPNIDGSGDWWSSSETNFNVAWYWFASSGGFANILKDYTSNYVRPVIEF